MQHLLSLATKLLVIVHSVSLCALRMRLSLMIPKKNGTCAHSFSKVTRCMHIFIFNGSLLYLCTNLHLLLTVSIIQKLSNTFKTGKTKKKRYWLYYNLLHQQQTTLFTGLKIIKCQL